jgi:hypothetical protein
MTLSEPLLPSEPSSKLVTLTMELANSRKDRGRRLRNRSETYAVGIHRGPDVSSFPPPYDLFSFCCYRALLLGSPCAVIKATVRPGGRKLLTEPLPAQRLKGQDAVEARYWSTRHGLLFLLDKQGGSYAHRRLFGYRHSDGVAVASWRTRASATWFTYRPEEVVRDPATGVPPTFADPEDFQRKAQVLARGEPLTKAQAWSTWFWLLLHTTFFAGRSPGSPEAPRGQPYLERWSSIQFGDLSLMKAGG